MGWWWWWCGGVVVVLLVVAGMTKGERKCQPRRCDQRASILIPHGLKNVRLRPACVLPSFLAHSSRVGKRAPFLTPHGLKNVRLLRGGVAFCGWLHRLYGLRSW